MTRDTNPNVCELVRVVFDRFAKRNQNDITQFRLLKTLFLTKERLSDGNPIKDQLAFYWYRYGPYSQVFVDNLVHMTDQSLITRNDNRTYTFVPDRLETPLASHDDAMNEAINIISEIARDFLRTSDIRNEVYKIAPYKWYTTYNDFNYKLHNYYRYLFEVQQKSPLCPYESIDILRPLHKTITTLPKELIFEKFRPVYYAFAHLAVSLLEAADLHDRKDEFETLCKLSDTVWNAFAYGVRICRHDKHYNGYIPTWQNQYNAALRDLCGEIASIQKQLNIPVPVDLQKLIALANEPGACAPDELLSRMDKIIS